MSIEMILFSFAMVFLLASIILPKTPFYNKRNQYISLSIGWVLFSLFWALRFPYYVFKTRSVVYLFVLPFAIIGCLLLASSALTAIKENKELPRGYFTVTTSGTIASLIYMPFTLVDFLRKWAIESMTKQTFFFMQKLGITNVEITVGPEFGYQSGLLFENDGLTYLTYIAQNCTGIGSMAIVLSILWITNISTPKKLLYSIASLLIIHILNTGRNIMIAVGYGNQWFDVLEPTLAPILGYEDPHLVSFFLIDKVIAQLGSVIALLIIFYIFLQKFPELQDRLMEVLILFNQQLPDTISNELEKYY